MTPVEACTLTLLFMSVLVIVRGDKYHTQLSAAIQNFEHLVAVTPSSIRSMEVQALKFYAMARGIQPGIYYSWEDCAPMVIGVKDTVYKIFLYDHEDRGVPV